MGDAGIKMTTHGGGSDLSHLTGTVVGPAATPYEGGTFELDIRVPCGYPFDPPQVKFITKIWHPNIDRKNGDIYPFNPPYFWSSGCTLVALLLSLQVLLSEPEPEYFLDTVVVKQYLKDYPTLVAKARNWTEVYAKKEIFLDGVGGAKVQEMANLGE